MEEEVEDQEDEEFLSNNSNISNKALQSNFRQSEDEQDEYVQQHEPPTKRQRRTEGKIIMPGANSPSRIKVKRMNTEEGIINQSKENKKRHIQTMDEEDSQMEKPITQEPEDVQIQSAGNNQEQGMLRLEQQKDSSNLVDQFSFGRKNSNEHHLSIPKEIEAQQQLLPVNEEEEPVKVLSEEEKQL